MYCSVRKLLMKRKPEAGGIYRHPLARIVTVNSADGIRFAVELDGEEEIARDAKHKWIFTLNESKRIDKLIVKRQWNVATITYWDFVDDVLRATTRNRFDWLNHRLLLAGRCAKWMEDFAIEKKIAEGIKRHFPHEQLINGVRGGIVDLVKDKADAVMAEITSEYSCTEEYQAFQVCLDVIATPLDALQKEEEIARKEARKAKRIDREKLKGSFQQGFQTGGLPKEQINTLYKTVASAVHPDRGGDEEAMKALNVLMTCIRQK